MAGVLESVINNNNNDEIFDELRREYYDNRILVFNDEIDDFMIDDFALWILKWNKEDVNVPVEKRKPIKLYISSPGGNVFTSNLISDVIEASKTPIWGVALDLVASAGLSIYLSCHRRIAFKNSAFLLHDGSVMIENSRKKSKDVMDFFNQGDERTKNHILEHTNIDSDFYDSIYSDEYWFYSQKGKELGVVHEIIGEDISMDEIM